MKYRTLRPDFARVSYIRKAETYTLQTLYIPSDITTKFTFETKYYEV